MAVNIVPLPEAEEIIFQMHAKSTSRILFQRWATRLGLSAFVIAPPIGFYWVSTYGSAWPFNPVAAVVSVLIAAVLFGKVMEPDTDDPDDHGVLRFENEWLDQIDCTRLAILCDQHPDLAAYRDLVVAKGRRFTRGEFNAMKAWPEEKKKQSVARARERIEREGCQRLYKLADY